MASNHNLRRACVLLLLMSWAALEHRWVWGQRPDSRNGPKVQPPAPAIAPVDNTRGGPNPGAGFGSGFSGFGGHFGGNLGGSGFSGFSFLPSVQRFQFQFKPDTPLKGLLPEPPPVKRPQPPWLVNDLAHVPEVFFQKPLGIRAPTIKEFTNRTEEEKKKFQEDTTAAQQKATDHIAHTLAKINHVNKKGTDQFIHALVDNRPDLAGLPFVTGDACRMSKAVSRQFVQEVFQIKPSGGFSGGFGFNGSFGGGTPFPAGAVQPGGTQPGDGQGPKAKPNTPPPPTADEVAQAKVAALMQVFGPVAKEQQLVKRLAVIEHPASTRALARLAVFSQDAEVVNAALAVLPKRPGADSAQILRDGLRYPWPRVAGRAAEVIVKLKRFDLATALADNLDEPDPRAPAVLEGHAAPVVREVVRLNHHHNCMTCHPPATSDPDFNQKGFPTDFITGAVSSPGVPLVPPSLGYMGSGSLSPDLFVRADITYLRQDFSLMQQVPDADPDPPVQRFDFLVRTREISTAEKNAYDAWLQRQGPGYRNPYQQSAHAALRRLTGRNVEPTATAWREELAFVGPRRR